jgi:hypothetical protein
MNWVSIYGILALVTGFLFLGQTILGLIGGIGKLEDFDRKNQLKPTEEPEQPQEETPEEK